MMLSPLQMIIGLYILMMIFTARCLFIWIDDESDHILGAFCCLFMSSVWPVVWIGRFVIKGFTNPFNPWR